MSEIGTPMPAVLPPLAGSPPAASAPAAAPAEPTFQIEMDVSNACRNCGSGALWKIIGPDNVGLGLSYGDKDKAEEMAEALSRAYEKGRQGEREHKRAVTAEIQTALEKMRELMNGGEP